MAKEKPILFNGEMVRAVLGGQKTQTRRVIKPQPESEFVKKDDGLYAPWATVWNNGTWHTWDKEGVGGENSVESSVDIAKTEAIKAAARQGFIKCPYGKPGYELWVKENFWCWGTWIPSTKAGRKLEFLDATDVEHPIRYCADDKFSFPDFHTGPSNGGNDYHRRPSIFMRREYSRTQLKIKDVRVERVQDITEEDAIAEGVYAHHSQSKDLETTPYYRSCFSATELFNMLWDSINEKRGFGWDTNPWGWVVEFERKTK